MNAMQTANIQDRAQGQQPKELKEGARRAEASVAAKLELLEEARQVDLLATPQAATRSGSMPEGCRGPRSPGDHRP